MIILVEFLIGLGPQGSQMVDLGCQDSYWVDGNERGFRCVFTAGQNHSSHFEHGQRQMWLSWLNFWLVGGSKGDPLGHRWLT